MINIRAVKKEDVMALNGVWYKHSFTGIAVEYNCELIAITGVMYSNPMQLFSVIKDEGRKYKKAFILAGRKVREMLKKIDAPVYAVPEDREGACRYLEWLGFEEVIPRQYIWRG